MCLQPTCSAFWCLPDGSPAPEELTYVDAFVNASVPCAHDNLEDIAPSPPSTDPDDGIITSRRFAKGWHCKQCGRLSCRYVRFVLPKPLRCNQDPAQVHMETLGMSELQGAATDVDGCGDMKADPPPRRPLWKSMGSFGHPKSSGRSQPLRRTCTIYSGKILVRRRRLLVLDYYSLTGCGT